MLQDALALQSSGQLAEAEARYREVLLLAPDHFDALHMLGVIRHQRGASAEAIELVGRALATHAGHAPAHSNLGLALLAEARAGEALEAFERALSLAPGLAEALSNRGNALVALGRHAEAIASFEQALGFEPRQPAVLSNLGNALVECRRHVDAAQVFERLVALDPDYDWALGSLIGARLACCDWTGFDALVAQVRRAVRSGRRASAALTFVTVADDPDEQLACARLQMRALAPVVPVGPPALGDSARLRIGYLSSDFREHANAYLCTGVLEHHDRARFDVLAFSTGPSRATPARERVERACDEFHDVRTMSDEAVARLVRDRGVHILVDVNGLTHGARTGVLARRPAPVQVNFLGFPGTMGAAFVDYVVVDRIVAPEGAERAFSESLVRMPDSYQPNDRARPLPAGRVARADAGLADDAFVFCCFNNHVKILPPVFDAWMRILHGVPGSVLWLLGESEASVGNLRREAAARDVDPDRLVFAARASHADHLERHALADLFLDTLPYNAHTTASDALWTGLPVVTCRGRSFAARVAASLLAAAGLRELACDDLASYEALALDIARSPDRLADLKATLAAERFACPLFDTERYARKLEDAYQRMWDLHRQGQGPQAFDLAP